MAASRALLDDVARRAGVALRCEAHARLCRLETDANHFDRARRHVSAARALLDGGDAAGEAMLRDAVEAAALALLTAERGPAAAASGHRGGGETLVVLAAAAVRAGDAARATRLLSKAGARGDLSVEATIDRLSLEGEIADFINVDPDLGRRCFQAAIALARRHGFHGRARYAEHQLRSARWMRTRDSCDARAYRTLSDRGDPALPARLRTSLALCAADIEMAIGRPQRALDAARAAERVAASSYDRLSAQALAAGAMLRLGCRRDAGLKAETTAVEARAAGHPRIVSLAQRICAQVHWAAGNRRAAHGAIEESIDCARRFSSAHVYAQTQALLGRIAGTRP